LSHGSQGSIPVSRRMPEGVRRSCNACRRPS
jgi:hypothetical protein